MARDIRICFIGDSFVNGTGDETALGWAGRLCAAACQSGIPVTYYNLGIRRDTSKDILLRWENECALRLPDFCDGRVVVSCGVNDTVIEDGTLRVRPEDSCAHIREILRGAQKYGVIMVGPPPVDDDEQNVRIKALAAAFEHEAKGLGVPYIDLFTPLAADAAFKKEIAGNDGAHPRSNGYLKMATIIRSSPQWWFPAP
ncbi:MAG: GDSL-type esterase/lipase family protein [Nitrospirota bacterium]